MSIKHIYEWPSKSAADLVPNFMVAHPDYTLLYKQGVWNPYKPADVDTVVRAIRNSGYGAGVSVDDAKKELYVSIPSSGDMF